MSKPLKPRRGTTAEQNAFVGEAYEVTYDTDKNTLVCRDGLTAGGFPLAKADEVAQKNAEQDEAIAGKLDTSGGTVKGQVNFEGYVVIDGGYILRGSDDGALYIMSGSGWGNAGAYISICPLASGGHICLHTKDASGNIKELVIKPDGTFLWGADKVLHSGMGAPIPTGTVISSASNKELDGFLLCNGAAVSRTTYAALFATIGTTYGEGDGSTTFNLPDLNGRVIQGTNGAPRYIEAGLPDIIGHLQLNAATSASVGGDQAFKVVQTDFNYGGGSGKSYGADIDFYASRSNAVYGNSDTVQPPALALRHFIKY